MEEGAFSRALIGERALLLKWIRTKFSLSTADAEDFVQETMLRAWINRASYDDQKKIRAWLMVILVNMVLSHKRRAWRLQFYDPQPNDDGAYLFDRGASGGQEDALYLKQVLTEMTKLHPDQLDAIIFIARGEQYDQVGEIMSTAPGTIKSRLSRGRRALKEALE